MGPRLPISLGDHSLPAMIENFHQQLTATYLIRFICRLFLASAACKETAHLRPVCSNTRVSSRSEERVRGCGRILPPLDSSHADVRTVSIWRSFVFFSIEFAFFLFVLGSRSLTALDFDFGSIVGFRSGDGKHNLFRALEGHGFLGYHDPAAKGRIFLYSFPHQIFLHSRGERLVSV